MHQRLTTTRTALATVVVALLTSMSGCGADATGRPGAPSSSTPADGYTAPVMPSRTAAKEMCDVALTAWATTNRDSTGHGTVAQVTDVEARPGFPVSCTAAVVFSTGTGEGPVVRRLVADLDDDGTHVANQRLFAAPALR